MNEIPIRNIYYMVLYAFDNVKNKSVIDGKSYEKDYTSSHVIIDLFLNEVSKIIKNGIYRNYISVEEESIFIKGKLDVKRNAVKKSSKKITNYDEFSSDLIENEIIKYTLNKILFSNLKQNQKKKAKNQYSLFHEVSYKSIDDSSYDKISFNRLNKSYSFALQLSIFINKKIIPMNSKGKLQFINIFEDEETMSIIYEAFLRNFYSIHTDYKVKVKEYKWYLKPLSVTLENYLPKMRTDIEITEDENSKIIIDAKFYKSALTSRYDSLKLSSNNMYQINTYLTHNLEYEKLRGILLYPSNGFELSQIYYRENKYRIEFNTIDLSMDWCKIVSRLLQIIEN